MPPLRPASHRAEGYIKGTLVIKSSFINFIDFLDNFYKDNNLIVIA